MWERGLRGETFGTGRDEMSLAPRNRGSGSEGDQTLAALRCAGGDAVHELHRVHAILTPSTRNHSIVGPDDPSAAKLPDRTLHIERGFAAPVMRVDRPTHQL